MKRVVPLFIIILCIVIMWSIYGKISNNHAIATAVSGSHEDVLTTDAVFVRREYTIKASGDGYFQNSVGSGSKVHKGQNVGYYYVGEPDKELVNKLNILNEKIKAAQESPGVEGAFVDDSISIDNKIAAYTKQISSLAAEGKQTEINKIRAQIDVLLERKAVIESGKTSSKVSVIETLKAQKKELENQLMGNKTDLYAPAPGVFVPGADGLEETLTPQTVKTMTVQTLSEILNRKEYTVDEGIYPKSVCKIIDNSEWILALVCDEKRLQGINVGEEIEVRFTNEGDITEICRVEGVSDPQDGKVVLMLKGSIELFQMQSVRKTNIDIVLKNYKGLKVPVSALKKEAGKDVVYVSAGSKVQARQVNVLYKNNDIAIIEENNAGENALLLYDEVVLQ